MTQQTKTTNTFCQTIAKLNAAAKETMAKPVILTAKTIETVKILKMVRRQAGEFNFMFDQIMDPQELNESIVKIEMGIAYLKQADAQDRVELINDIIRELKSCRSIAKRMDETDVILSQIEEELQEELPVEGE